MATKKRRKKGEEAAIIFLDFDGVLNSERYFAKEIEAKGNANLDVALVKKMQRFVEDVGGAVVVSSTWREGRSLSEIKKILKERGFEKVDLVIGKTPKLYDDDDYDAPRGVEIDRYMSKRKVPFVIFDDDGDMFPVEKFLVETDPRLGVTGRDFQKARAILKRQGHRT